MASLVARPVTHRLLEFGATAVFLGYAVGFQLRVAFASETDEDEPGSLLPLLTAASIQARTALGPDAGKPIERAGAEPLGADPCPALARRAPEGGVLRRPLRLVDSLGERRDAHQDEGSGDPGHGSCEHTPIALERVVHGESYRIRSVRGTGERVASSAPRSHAARRARRGAW